MALSHEPNGEKFGCGVFHTWILYICGCFCTTETISFHGFASDAWLSPMVTMRSETHVVNETLAMMMLGHCVARSRDTDGSRGDYVQTVGGVCPDMDTFANWSF